MIYKALLLIDEIHMRGMLADGIARGFAAGTDWHSKRLRHAEKSVQDTRRHWTAMAGARLLAPSHFIP